MAQLYPPENAPGPSPPVQKAYIDVINGTMHSRDQVTRDYYGNLRRADDIDEMNRDDLKQYWRAPVIRRFREP